MTTATQPPDILTAEFAQNPYPAYEIMRDDFPVHWHEGTQSYIVSRYADVERVFKDKRFSSDNYDWQLEPVHGRTLLQMDGREHSTHRALVTPAFRGRDLAEKFIPVIERNSRELIDTFREAGSVDLVDQYANHFPINVIVDMLDLPRADHDRFRRWYVSTIAFLSNLAGDPQVAAAGERTRAEFEAYLIPLIRERRENPGPDLLTTLCTAEIDGVRMSDHEIKAFCSLLLSAGGETTDKVMGSLFKNLVEHPDQLEAVRADRSLIARALAETLRYSPPVHMIMRQPTEPVELAGVTLEPGRTVTVLIGAANRDPRQFQEPDTFNLFRDDLPVERAYTAGANHAAFALGRHFCVGAMLAKAEVEIGTNRLLDAMADLRPADEIAAGEKGVFTRGPDHLRLTFTPTGGVGVSGASGT